MKFLDPATILELDVNIFTKVNKADKPSIIFSTNNVRLDYVLEVP